MNERVRQNRRERFWPTGPQGRFLNVRTGGARALRSYGLDATAGGDFGESAVRATIAPEMNSATAPARSNAEVRGDFIERSSQR
jgi:hypothetical protein